MYYGFVAVMVLVPVIGIVLTLFLRSLLNGFRSRTRFIENRRDLDDFARVASMAMYGSIVQIVLLFVPLVFYMLGVVQGLLSILDVLFVVVPSGLYLLAYVRYKGLEEEVRGMQIDDQDLLSDYIFITETWKKNSLPKW